MTIHSPNSKTKLELPKLLVQNLPLLINTAVDTLNSLTELKAQKLTHSISKVDASVDDDTISAMMKFEGDITGTFLLIFPKTIAIQALTSLIGDDMDPENAEELRDGIGEFCNMIVGSSKVNLQEKDIKVNFGLPKTYDSIKKASILVGNKEGIWIEMALDEERFYIHIST